MKIRIVIMLIFLLGSCLVMYNPDKPVRSFLGDYNPSLSNGMFSANLNYEGYKTVKLKSKYAPPKLPWINIEFNNPTDSFVVIEFPFNWHEYFCKDPLFFRFNDSVYENNHIELFYPNKEDTINDFIMHAKYVYLKPKESLYLEAYIYNDELINSSDKKLNFSLWFRYLYTKRKKTINSDLKNKFIIFQTNSIQINSED